MKQLLCVKPFTCSLLNISMVSLDQWFSNCGMQTPWGLNDSFTGLPKTFKKATDISITIRNSNEVAMTLLLWLGVTTRWGTVSTGHSIGKGENTAADEDGSSISERNWTSLGSVTCPLLVLLAHCVPRKQKSSKQWPCLSLLNVALVWSHWKARNSVYAGRS